MHRGRTRRYHRANAHRSSGDSPLACLCRAKQRKRYHTCRRRHPALHPYLVARRACWQYRDRPCARLVLRLHLRRQWLPKRLMGEYPQYPSIGCYLGGQQRYLYRGGQRNRNRFCRSPGKLSIPVELAALYGRKPVDRPRGKYACFCHRYRSSQRLYRHSNHYGWCAYRGERQCCRYGYCMCRAEQWHCFGTGHPWHRTIPVFMADTALRPTNWCWPNHQQPGSRSLHGFGDGCQWLYGHRGGRHRRSVGAARPYRRLYDRGM